MAAAGTVRVSAGRRSTWLSALFLTSVFVALRVPSFLEPTWYSDEGTYADIGRALLHGAVLYRDVWDNKPPGVYWLAAAVISVLGPGAPAFPVVLALLLAAGAVAVWRLGRVAGGVGTATVASLVFIVLASLPNLEGDLFNAEIVGAVLVLWAIVLLMDSREDLIRTLIAGGLLGSAFLFKGVFVLDVIAGASIPLWAARAAGKPWRSSLPRVGTVVAGAAGVAAATGAVLAAQGALGGLLDVIGRQDISYVQLTAGPGGSVLRSTSGGTRAMSTALLSLRLTVPLLGLGLVARRLSRRGRFWAAVVAFWLGCDLAGAMVSTRGFSHYAQQADGALALGVALVACKLWRRGRLARAGAALAVLAAFPVLEFALFAPSAEVALARRLPFPHLEQGSFHTPEVARYYRLSWGRLTGGISQAQYEAIFPTDLARQRAVIQVFRRYSRPGDRVFVWGVVHWSYALSDRLPGGRYVSLNTAYLVDPGSHDRLVRELTAHPPTVLVVDATLPPEMVDLLGRLHYSRIPGVAAGDDVWLAPTAQL